MFGQGPLLRIIPLGGLEEIGKNMMVFEYGEDLVVIDAGLMFPDDSMLGIDLVVQDFSYLEERRDRVRGYVITHGHEDHTGALPYVLPKVPAPVYATRLTRGLIEVKLREHKLLDKTELVTIAPGQTVAFGALSLEFFHQCHSIPDAVGVAVHSPLGTVVHTGDFKFDQTPVDGRPPDYNALARLGSNGVLALFSDSTRADTPGFTPSEAVIADAFHRVFNRAEGRIIVATFASLISRVQQVIDAAVEFDRRVAVIGRSMINNVSRAIELGYLRVPSGVMARLDELERIPHDRLAVVTTGSQGEPSSALTRMANGDQKHVQIVKGDTVIISSTPIPGNEELVARNVDNLFKLGANVVYDRHEQVHVSGHGAADELKLMIGLLRPRYLIPIHGQYRHLVMHQRLGVQMGMPEENILVIDNGTVLETDGVRLARTGHIEAGYVFVDGLGVGEIGDVVLRDRQVLSRDGIVVAILTVDRQTGRPLAAPDIVTRGFVHVSNADALIEMARKVVYDALDAHIGDPAEWTFAKTKIKETLNKFLYEKTKRRPMIIPVVMEV
ncbi:MAG: RNA-metabolising metallo-beta-lactamase [Chloroflexi bacterium]|nr:RNA-metabolising metallo-beta-lactamase [Chloroflexota bacterium]